MQSTCLSPVRHLTALTFRPRSTYASKLYNRLFNGVLTVTLQRTAGLRKVIKLIQGQQTQSFHLSAYSNHRLTYPPLYQIHQKLLLNSSSTIRRAVQAGRMMHSDAVIDSPTIRVTRISQLLELREVVKWDSKITTPGMTKPLVILLPFLYASAKAVDAYCGLYHDCGLDVLTVPGELRHFLRPSRGQAAAQEILTFLSGNHIALNTDRFIVHAMSVGAFIYAIVLAEFLTHHSKYEPVRRKIIGHVFDSIVVGNFTHMAKGISQLTRWSWLQPILYRSALWYLKNGPNTEVYQNLINSLKRMPVKCPTLFFYSHDDEMCDPRGMEDLVRLFQSDPLLDISVCSWMHSKHAMHLRLHPVQYQRALHEFLVKIGLASVKLASRL